jgi:hypothetical protein
MHLDTVIFAIAAVLAETFFSSAVKVAEGT